jgi:hypothetical protein
MGFRVCENCTEDRAVANSDLCDICEDAFDDNAFINGMSVEDYAKALGVVVLPREGVR